MSHCQGSERESNFGRHQLRPQCPDDQPLPARLPGGRPHHAGESAAADEHDPGCSQWHGHDWLCADPENGELEYRVKKRVADFLRSVMKAYGLNETPLRYTCGEIDYYVYRNAKNVPMLTVGSVKNMSHANYPKESWIAYDEFMCRFSRREDGTLLYMGEEAT